MRDSSRLSSDSFVYYPLFNAPLPPGLETIKYPTDHGPPQRQSKHSHERSEVDLRDRGTLLQKRSIQTQQGDETPLVSTPPTDTRPLSRKKERPNTTKATTVTTATNMSILDPDQSILVLKNIEDTAFFAPKPDDPNLVDSPNAALPSPMSELGSIDQCWTYSTWNDLERPSHNSNSTDVGS
jgi:hypothetical protein